MTHDELLRELAKSFTGNLEKEGYILDLEKVKKYVKALHAVVELHKPRADNGCSECQNPYADTDGWNDISAPMPYPCPTIQAIEKELA